MYRLRMLGRLSLERDGAEIASDRQALVVLATLALKGGEAERDEVVRLVWPDRDAPRGRQCLRQERHELRRLTGLECVEVHGGRLRISSNISVDLADLRQAILTGDTEATISLYDPPLMGGLAGHLPKSLESETDAAERWAREGALHAYELAARHFMEVSEPHSARDLLLRMSRLDPLSPSVQRRVFDHLKAMKEWTLALAVGEEYLTLLEGETGGTCDDMQRRIEMLRREARTPLPEVGPAAPTLGRRDLRWSSPRAGVAAALAIGVGIAAVASSAPSVPPPWASGYLMSSSPEGAALFEFDSDGELVLVDSAWRDGDIYPVAVLPPTIGSTIVGVRRSESQPQAVVVRTRDRWELLWEGSGDLGTAIGPPDATGLLVWVETGAHEYQLDIHHYDLLHGDQHVLAAPPGGWPGDAAWSPDGRHVVVANAYVDGPDSVLILRPNGVPEAAWAAPGRVNRARFCGNGRVVTSIQLDGALSSAFMLTVNDGSFTELSVGRSGSPFACSPDGRYLMAGRTKASDAELVLYDLDQRSVVRQWTVPPLMELVWLPSDLRLPHAIEATVDSTEIPLGGRTAIRADVLDGHGSRWSGPVEWRSLDPQVARVRDSLVIGNRPGRVRIVGLANGWLADTVELTVSSQAGPATYSVDALTSFDTLTRWQPLGDPIPAIAHSVDGPVLRMRGDGAYADGMVGRTGAPWQEGITVTLDFKLALTRRDRQSILLCLVESVDPAPELARRYPEYDVHAQGCVRYPNHETVRFRDDKVALQNGPSIEFEVHALPTSGWASLGLQLHADGRLQALLNGEVVGEHPNRMTPHPDAELRVAVFGREFETELLIRNLVVWRGARYPATSSSPGERTDRLDSTGALEG